MTRQLARVATLLVSSAAIIPSPSVAAAEQHQNQNAQQYLRPGVRQRRAIDIVANLDVILVTTEAPLPPGDPLIAVAEVTTVAATPAAAGTTTTTTTTVATGTTIVNNPSPSPPPTSGPTAPIPAVVTPGLTTPTNTTTTTLATTTISGAASETTSATYGTLANGNPIINPGGTCGKGKGDRGNGICADGRCCSKHGWCGDSPAHCDGLTFPPTLTPTLPPLPAIPTSSPSAKPTQQSPTVKPTSGEPTSSPSARDIVNITPGHKKFCGPKIVGGLEIAMATCSVATECGKEVLSNHYGGTGNDCPKNYMCFNDIDCIAPTSVPSASPSLSPSTTVPSTTPTVSVGPTVEGQTKAPTIKPTFSIVPTASPTDRRPPTVPPANLMNSVTTRGSFCGATFTDAVNQCGPSIACDRGTDCNDGQECWPNISCTYHISEASSENYLQGNKGEGEKGAEGDDLYGIEFDDTEFGEEYTPDESSAMQRRSDFRYQAGMIATAVLGILWVGLIV